MILSTLSALTNYNFYYAINLSRIMLKAEKANL